MFERRLAVSERERVNVYFFPTRFDVSIILPASYYVIECYAVARFSTAQKDDSRNEWAFELLLFCDRNFTFDVRGNLWVLRSRTSLLPIDSRRCIFCIRVCVVSKQRSARTSVWPRQNVESRHRCSRPLAAASWRMVAKLFELSSHRHTNWNNFRSR